MVEVDGEIGCRALSEREERKRAVESEREHRVVENTERDSLVGIMFVSFTTTLPTFQVGYRSCNRSCRRRSCPWASQCR